MATRALKSAAPLRRRKPAVPAAAPLRRRQPLPAATLADATDGPLRGLIGYALRRAQLRVFDDFFEQLAGESITPARFSALMVVHAHPGVTQAELAHSLDIAPSGVAALLDSLEKAGFVRRSPIEQNRRAYALNLTTAGNAKLRRLGELVAEHESRVCARLSTEEKRRLLDLLARVG
jgi:DNA-binding MarR family transcriptional regulator